MNEETTNEQDEMRDHYDFSKGGVRGKYYERYKQGTNIVLLDPDVAEVFTTSKKVNDALRSLLKSAGKEARPAVEP